MRGDQYLYGDVGADAVDVSKYDGCMCGFCVLTFIKDEGGLVPVEPKDIISPISPRSYLQRQLGLQVGKTYAIVEFGGDDE